MWFKFLQRYKNQQKIPKHKHHLPILFLMKTTGIGIFFLTFEENLPSCWQKMIMPENKFIHVI